MSDLSEFGIRNEKTEKELRIEEENLKAVLDSGEITVSQAKRLIQVRKDLKIIQNVKYNKDY